ncbi:peptidylprolyl isomerase [Aquicoccus sp. SU-CL01552]|uniref:peptidylprolyl isomerase n=1 Tax=Aquicoccus sp. SU-CL01552 TaxID=3127656 RepID=UPI003106B181
MRKILTPLLTILHRNTCFSVRLAAMALIATLPGATLAQGLFSPAITVNGDAITGYELEQRALLLRVLNAPGNTPELARKALIEDKLKLQAAKAAGIELTPEELKAGMDEFAGRANMSTDALLQALAQENISRQTLRDFVKVNLLWRNYVTARFGARARPTDAEVDRAMGRGGASGGIQVLLSEVIIPITPQTAAQVEALADRIAQVKGYDAFSAAATQYSASNSRADGGRLGWMPLTRLPAPLQSVILGLKKGEVTAPLALPNAVALFQMRGIRETGGSDPSYAKIDYASYLIPGGRSPEALATAQRIIDSTDTCDDLYGIAKDQPPQVLERNERAPRDIPRDVALELSKLDTDETSTALTRNNGQTLVLLMLCGRTAQSIAEASRDQIGNALIEQRLQSFSASQIEQLRADAQILER